MDGRWLTFGALVLAAAAGQQGSAVRTGLVKAPLRYRVELVEDHKGAIAYNVYQLAQHRPRKVIEVVGQYNGRLGAVANIDIHSQGEPWTAEIRASTALAKKYPTTFGKLRRVWPRDLELEFPRIPNKGSGGRKGSSVRTTLSSPPVVLNRFVTVEVDAAPGGVDLGPTRWVVFDRDHREVVRSKKRYRGKTTNHVMTWAPVLYDSETGSSGNAKLAALAHVASLLQDSSGLGPRGSAKDDDEAARWYDERARTAVFLFDREAWTDLGPERPGSGNRRGSQVRTTLRSTFNQAAATAAFLQIHVYKGLRNDGKWLLLYLPNQGDPVWPEAKGKSAARLEMTDEAIRAARDSTKIPIELTVVPPTFFLEDEAGGYSPPQRVRVYYPDPISGTDRLWFLGGALTPKPRRPGRAEEPNWEEPDWEWEVILAHLERFSELIAAENPDWRYPPGGDGDPVF